MFRCCHPAAIGFSEAAAALNAAFDANPKEEVLSLQWELEIGNCSS
jgi:hypothetical protein